MGVELLNYRKDGTPFYVEISIVPALTTVRAFRGAQRLLAARSASHHGGPCYVADR